jgi:hypothetical protein
MANRRMTSSELFEDDFIGSLDFFQRYMWIGLFVACADDQGRFADSHAIIRAKVFPYDRDVTDDIVEAALCKFFDAGKIARYVVNGKQLIQIVKWWSYQSPSWASPSKYPAPDGWTDRYKYHTTGNKISVENWNTPGGYTMLHSGQGSKLHSGQGSAIDKSESESEVKSESESEGDDEINKQEPVVVPKSKDKKPLSATAASMLMARLITSDVIKELLEVYQPDMIIDYCHAYDQAVKDRTADNPGWLVRGLKQQWNIKKLLKKREEELLQDEPARYVTGKYATFVEH